MTALVTAPVVPTIELACVGKRYAESPADAWVLTNVSLQVAEAEFVALMGPSGSGKSTLLNLVAGLDVPTTGTVRLAGEPLAELSDDARSDLRLRHVGFVFQTFNLFANLTAEENVAWPRRMLGAPWREARLRAATLLHEVGLDASAHRRPPAMLSGGEQQRVAIARALVNEPRMLLADEPTGNLDSRTASAIIDLLGNASATRGLTVLLVSHNPAITRRAARVLDLDDGRLVQRDGRSTDASLSAGRRA